MHGKNIVILLSSPTCSHALTLTWSQQDLTLFSTCNNLGWEIWDAEVHKVRQPGNLVARKFLKNQVLAESFWIFPLHFLKSKQFGKNVKEILLLFFKKIVIILSIFHNIPKMQWKFELFHFHGTKIYFFL